MATHHGSCHCGAVSFDVELDLTNLMTCNCSICGRTGSIMAFVPADAFTLRSSEERLTDYQFGKKNVHHLFCEVCGVRSFTWGTNRNGDKMMSVNVRCLDGIDVHTLEAQKFDGKSL